MILGAEGCGPLGEDLVLTLTVLLGDDEVHRGVIRLWDCVIACTGVLLTAAIDEVIMIGVYVVCLSDVLGRGETSRGVILVLVCMVLLCLNVMQVKF